jgi:hypothetical protein
MKYKLIIGAMMILLLIMASGLSCIQTGGSMARAEVSVIKQELTTDGAGNVVAQITVKNTGRVKSDLTEVTVRFYDAQKNLIDSGRDSVLSLEPDETWDFTIPCAGEGCKDIRSFEVETLAGTSSGGL